MFTFVEGASSNSNLRAQTDSSSAAYLSEDTLPSILVPLPTHDLVAAVV
jgi:hypothetical protein